MKSEETSETGGNIDGRREKFKKDGLKNSLPSNHRFRNL